jgi:hypothetical protein
LQPLDLVVFSAFKQTRSSHRSNLPRKTPEGQITLTAESWEIAGTSRNIRSSFAASGLLPDISVTPYRVRFDEKILRESPDFIEAYQKKISVQSLSPRRQRTIWGAANYLALGPMPQQQLKLYLKPLKY